MTSTLNLDLPLVQAAQAQKHVTVNEALARLDGLTQLTLESVTVTSPPLGATDGMAHAVPARAGGAWSGQTGKVAIASNGGWVFVAPQAGWRAWIRDRGRAALFDGVGWADGAVALSPNGAASVFDVVEADIAVASGASVTTADLIPAFSVVMGVSGIVTDALAGGLTGWRLGVPGGPSQYGSGLGTALGSWVQGLSGQPQAFYADTPLVLEAEGGNFAGGEVRLAVHLFRMTLPRP